MSGWTDYPAERCDRHPAYFHARAEYPNRAGGVYVIDKYGRTPQEAEAKRDDDKVHLLPVWLD